MELKNAQADVLLNDIAIGATTATLTGGNFGTPVGAIYLTFDYNVSANYEVKLCTVAGTGITGMSHISGANVAHTAGCKVGRMINAEVVQHLIDGTGFDAGAIPTAAIANGAVTSAKAKLTCGQVVSTTDTSVGATPADINGATVTLSVTVASVITVNAIFGVKCVSQNFFSGLILIDGTSVGIPASCEPPATNYGASYPATCCVNLAVGSHTIKLQGVRQTGSDSATFIGTGNCGFTYSIVSQ
jgi:hypothetical protein